MTQDEMDRLTRAELEALVRAQEAKIEALKGKPGRPVQNILVGYRLPLYAMKG